MLLCLFKGRTIIVLLQTAKRYIVT